MATFVTHRGAVFKCLTTDRKKSHPDYSGQHINPDQAGFMFTVGV